MTNLKRQVDKYLGHDDLICYKHYTFPLSGILLNFIASELLKQCLPKLSNSSNKEECVSEDFTNEVEKKIKDNNTDKDYTPV